MAKSLITAEEKRAEPLEVGGLSITVLASENDTDGYEIFHVNGAKGKGPGSHYHPWDESLYVVRGQIHCGVGDEEVMATAGTLIHIPAGTVHWFRVQEDGSEFISTTSKGNASKMFTDFSQGINWESPDRQALVEVAARHGQIVVE
jgi:quercetin dioxygenase-like cupin family protein